MASFSQELKPPPNPGRFTVSIGIAHAKYTSMETINLMISRADVALYKAKKAGRNCLNVTNYAADK